MTSPASVVGLGLIGGSLARRMAGLGWSVTCWDADPATRAAAAAGGLAVAPSLSVLAAAGGAIFVAVPLPAVDGVFASISAAAPGETIVSDVTSVKLPVRALAGRHGLTFVGGHPMAGTAESGFAAGSAELLAGASWVLTLDEETTLAAWLQVAAVVTSLGCRVVPCTSSSHDAAVATVSHLPHVLAAALVIAAGDDPLALALAAGSFRDATRVAATRPALVAAMCGGNAAALGEQLTALSRRLDEVGEMLGRPAELMDFFAAAQAVRRDWPATPALETALPAGASLRGRLLEVGLAGGHVVSVEPTGVKTRVGPPTVPATPQQ